MEFKVAKKEFEEVVDLVSRYVSRNTTLPVLENIYIKAQEDFVVVRGTDMSKYIEFSFPAEVQAEGAMTVNARTLWEFLKTLDDGDLQIEADEGKSMFSLKSNGDTIQIKGIPASEYVAIPEINPQQTISLPAAYFVEGVKKVEFAVSDRSLTAVLTGILVRLKKEDAKNYLIFAGTDALRLADYRVEINWETQPFSVIVPKMNVGELTKAIEFGISKDVDEVKMDITESFVGIEILLPGNKKIYASSVLIEGNFPDYENENIMPTKFNATIKVSPAGLEKAIKKVVILTKGLNYFVDIKGDVDKVIVSSWETDMWEVRTTLKAIVDGQNIEFGVNGKQILDFLKEVEGEIIDLNIVDNERPIILKDPTIPSYTYIVRPLVK